MLRFEISDEDQEKIENFHPQCKRKYWGSIGGDKTYIFIPTSLGMIIKYRCGCGKELDLSHTEEW